MMSANEAYRASTKGFSPQEYFGIINHEIEEAILEGSFCVPFYFKRSNDRTVGMVVNYLEDLGYDVEKVDENLISISWEID